MKMRMRIALGVTWLVTLSIMMVNLWEVQRPCHQRTHAASPNDPDSVFFRRDQVEEYGNRGCACSSPPQTNATHAPVTRPEEPEVIYKVPNIVHYIWYSYSTKPLEFHQMLSVFSADQVLKPDVIYFHTNLQPVGKYWLQVKQLPSLRINYRKPPEKLYGERLKDPVFYTSHSNVDRLAVLAEYGGVYLDLDVLVTKSFDELRKRECTIGLENPQLACNSVIICAKESPFLMLWINSYLDDYQVEEWSYNAGKVPYKLAQRFPGLVYLEHDKINRPNSRELSQIWGSDKIAWQDNYAVHLWFRIWKTMSPFYTGEDPNEDNVMLMDSTFGEIARTILYGDPGVVDENAITLNTLPPSTPAQVRREPARNRAPVREDRQRYPEARPDILAELGQGEEVVERGDYEGMGDVEDEEGGEEGDDELYDNGQDDDDDENDDDYNGDAVTEDDEDDEAVGGWQQVADNDGMREGLQPVHRPADILDAQVDAAYHGNLAADAEFNPAREQMEADAFARGDTLTDDDDFNGLGLEAEGGDEHPGGFGGRDEGVLVGPVQQQQQQQQYAADHQPIQLPILGQQQAPLEQPQPIQQQPQPIQQQPQPIQQLPLLRPQQQKQQQQPLLGPQQPLLEPQQPLLGPQQPLLGPQQPLLGPQQPLLQPFMQQQQQQEQHRPLENGLEASQEVQQPDLTRVTSKFQDAPVSDFLRQRLAKSKEARMKMGPTFQRPMQPELPLLPQDGLQLQQQLPGRQEPEQEAQIPEQAPEWAGIVHSDQNDDVIKQPVIDDVIKQPVIDDAEPAVEEKVPDSEDQARPDRVQINGIPDWQSGRYVWVDDAGKELGQAGQERGHSPEQTQPHLQDADDSPHPFAEKQAPVPVLAPHMDSRFQPLQPQGDIPVRSQGRFSDPHAEAAPPLEVRPGDAVRVPDNSLNYLARFAKPATELPASVPEPPAIQRDGDHPSEALNPGLPYKPRQQQFPPLRFPLPEEEMGAIPGVKARPPYEQASLAKTDSIFRDRMVSRLTPRTRPLSLGSVQRAASPQRIPDLNKPILEPASEVPQPRPAVAPFESSLGTQRQAIRGPVGRKPPSHMRSFDSREQALPRPEQDPPQHRFGFPGQFGGRPAQQLFLHSEDTNQQFNEITDRARPASRELQVDAPVKRDTPGKAVSTEHEEERRAAQAKEDEIFAKEAVGWVEPAERGM